MTFVEGKLDIGMTKKIRESTIHQEILIKTVARLVAKPKGILAIDESMPTCNKRFEKLGVPTTEEKRREYRELLVTAPGIEQYISG